MAINLTVIVKDTDGKLAKDVSVSATPGKATGVTNDKGEATLKLEATTSRFEVTVIDGQNTETVPFYPVEGQDSARLEVSLKYFKQLHDKKAAATTSTQAASNPWYTSPVTIIGIGLVVVLVITAIILWHRKTRTRYKI